MTRRKQASRKTLVADARHVLQHCAGMNARLVARQISRFIEARIEASGLGVAQFGLMAHVAATEDDTIGALAQRSGLDQSTLSRNLHALEREGLVEIAVVEKDLRQRAVWLTEAGARRLEAAIPLWRRAHAELATAMAPADLRKLAAIARALSYVAAD